MTIAVVVCHRQVGYPEMWRHLSPCLGATQAAGHKVIQMASEGLVVGQMRNEMVAQALSMGAEAICFIDDDHVFAPDAINRLVAWHRPIVGASYPTRNKPFRSTAMISVTDEGYRGLNVKELQTDGLVSVDAIGMGMTLIHQSVFHQLPEPWFRTGGRPQPCAVLS